VTPTAPDGEIAPFAPEEAVIVKSLRVLKFEEELFWSPPTGGRSRTDSALPMPEWVLVLIAPRVRLEARTPSARQDST
jgi:hypothetical protein